jgi:hypothetical protein
MVETRSQRAAKTKMIPPGPLSARALQGLSEYKYKASGYTVSELLRLVVDVSWVSFKTLGAHVQILDRIHNPAWNGAWVTAGGQHIMITVLHANKTASNPMAFICQINVKVAPALCSPR